MDCLGAINFPLDFLSGKWARFYADGTGDVEAVRKNPAMLVEGLRDRAIFPDVVMTHVRAAFPHAAVVELQHAGHFCQEDEPEAVVALIQQFLELT